MTDVSFILSLSSVETFNLNLLQSQNPFQRTNIG